MDRSRFPFIGDEDWNTLTVMSTLIGGNAMQSILQLSPEALANTISLFRDNERKIAASNNDRISEARNEGVESARQEVQTQLLMRERMPLKSRPLGLQLKVSTYDGKEEENLLRWFAEFELAAEISHVDQNDSVGYAITYLGGRAKEWALNMRIVDRSCFTSWEDFKRQLTSTFQPPRCEFKQMQKLLRLTQHSDLHTFVQEIRFLSASIVNLPMTEATKVSIFMSGLKVVQFEINCIAYFQIVWKKRSPLRWKKIFLGVKLN